LAAAAAAERLEGPCGAREGTAAAELDKMVDDCCCC